MNSAQGQRGRSITEVIVGSENGEADIEFHVACQHERDGGAMTG